MQVVNVDKVDDAKIILRNHKFGKYDANEPSIFALKMPFGYKSSDGNESPVFNVCFDVFKGYLLFLLEASVFSLHRGHPKPKVLQHAFALCGKYQYI